MASDHLQIPDVLANQSNKEATANAQTNSVDRAMNGNVQIAVSAGDNNLTTTQARENFLLELTGTPGAVFNLDMPDGNKRVLAVVNNADDVCTIRNNAGGGTGQPVLNVGEGVLFHFDGTDFLDITALALSVSTFTGLTDTPGSFANLSGQLPTVNNAETALEYIKTTMKLPVRLATTAAQVLATDFENTDVIDGVALVTGDRVLIKDQGTGAENGIYLVQATGAPVRSADFDDDADVEGGVTVMVQEGSSNADTLWALTNNGAITVDTTALVFASLADISTFLALSDTPGAFTNHSGKEVRVNAGETALEFVPKGAKDPVRVATTAAGTLATDFENADTVDGISLATGDRILIKNQAAPAENGIYTVEATGAPSRAIDFDDDADAVTGATIPVLAGTVNANSMWQHTTTGAITIGSTSLTWAQITGGGGDRWVEATVQTTTATVTNIAAIALASGEAKVVRGFLIGTLLSSANSFAASFVAAGKNNGGTSAQLAAASITKLDGDGGNSWDVTIDVDDTSDTIRIRVTGQGSTTIDWRVQYEVITEDNV